MNFGGMKQWAFALCAAMVACGIAQMLLPKGNMQKIMQMTVSVFFLCCMLSPVALQNTQLRIDVQEYAQEEIDRRAEQLTREAERQAGQAAETGLAEMVRQKLDKLGIKPLNLAIHMNEDGQSAPEVELLLAAEHEQKRRQIQQAVEEELGLHLQLRYAAEGG